MTSCTKPYAASAKRINSFKRQGWVSRVAIGDPLPYNVCMVYNVSIVMHRIGKTEYLTVHEVAKRLGISAGTVRVWTEKGVLKTVRHPVNKYRLYRKVDVERVLNSLEDQTK